MTNTFHDQLLYLQDPACLDFEAVAEEIIPLPEGQFGVSLNRTYFYPTGGGQEHDTGTIGEAQVLEVVKDEALGRVIHTLDRAIPLGPVTAHINRERRLRHSQHHTAQHLISQCIVRIFDIDSISANINGYTPSTVDVAADSFTRRQLDQVEDLANQVVFENLPVKASFVTPEELAALPLRWPPKVTENIRIIEIAGFDYSACGGTHVTAAGTIGLVKLLKTEKVNDRLRIHFVAGHQALEHYRAAQEIVSGLAVQLNTHPQEFAPTIERMAEQLKAAQRELQTLRLARVADEARELAAAAGGDSGGRRVIVAAFDNRPVIELRALVEEFKKMTAITAVLATFDGQKVSLVTFCTPGSGSSARDLLTRLIQPLGGRGGGDAVIAQGGGAISQEQYHALIQSIYPLIQEMTLL